MSALRACRCALKERTDHAKEMYAERRRRFGDVLDAKAEAMEQIWP